MISSDLLQWEQNNKLYTIIILQSQRRWSPGFSCNLNSYLLEHDHLGVTDRLPLSDHGHLKLGDLTVEEIDELHENLQQRMASLTRCISDFQRRQWFPNIELYKSKLLEDTYRTESQFTPPWFRALFMDGPRTFELVPTFPADLLVTSTEYQELSEASFKLTMSFVDSLRGIHGGLFISEKLSPRFKNNFDFGETTSFFQGSRSSKHLSSASWRRPHDYWNSNLDDQSTKIFRRTSQSIVPLSTAIYSNQSGIVLQPTNNNPSDWLTNYCYTAMPVIPIYKRRIVLVGKFEIEDAISSLEKLFRIVIILGEDNEIKGIYRRQMTSENSFLTWKIIFT